jgi:hypothetical protein
MAALNEHYLCPVCGYGMQEPAENYNICPSCGTEFGIHDVNASVQELRAVWLQNGCKWWGNPDQQPVNWNPYQQLARLAEAAFAGIDILSISSSGQQYDATPAVTPWAGELKAVWAAEVA